MVRINLYWFGKTKSRLMAEDINRYVKLLGIFADLRITEFQEETGSKEQIINRESEKVLKKMPEKFILLDEKGENYTSLEFADFIKNQNEINFLIGGVYGLSEQAKDKAVKKIALSKMTFTHEMTRIILLEQLYRAFCINKGKKYHY